MCLARGVEATGDPQQLVWALRRLAGPGAVLSGDQVSLEAAGRYLAVVDNQVVMLAAEAPESTFVLEIKETCISYRFQKDHMKL